MGIRLKKDCQMAHNKCDFPAPTNVNVMGKMLRLWNVDLILFTAIVEKWINTISEMRFSSYPKWTLL